MASKWYELPKGPKEAMKAVVAHYQSLSSLDVTILHHNSSGLFPGDYTQTLHWEKPTKFLLKVTKPAKTSKNLAPDYASDGTEVLANGGNGYPSNPQPLNKDPNVEPGYEVSAGPILSWLINSPTGNVFINPPETLRTSFEWAPSTSWHGLKVHTVVLSVSYPSSGTSQVQKVNIYLNDAGTEMVGYEITSPGSSGYLIYEDQKSS